MDTDVLRQNKIFQEIIQSCLTDVTFNKGMVQSSHAGSEERAGLGWVGLGRAGHQGPKSHLPKAARHCRGRTERAQISCFPDKTSAEGRF